jgi:hypothetical protein
MNPNAMELYVGYLIGVFGGVVLMWVWRHR